MRAYDVDDVGADDGGEDGDDDDDVFGRLPLGGHVSQISRAELHERLAESLHDAGKASRWIPALTFWLDRIFGGSELERAGQLCFG